MLVYNTVGETIAVVWEIAPAMATHCITTASLSSTAPVEVSLEEAFWYL